MKVKCKVPNYIILTKYSTLLKGEQKWQTLTASEDLYQSAINWLIQIRKG